MPAYNKTVKLPGRSSQELYDRVSKQIDELVEKWGLADKMELRRDPEKKQVNLKHSMVSATLSCTEGQMSLDAKLSLMAMPFRSKLDEQIETWIKKNFPA